MASSVIFILLISNAASIIKIKLGKVDKVDDVDEVDVENAYLALRLL